MKKVFLVIMACFIFITACAPACVCAKQDSITVYIDDEILEFDVAPKIVNGRTMVPMRKIFEYFGADVKWYDYNKSIYAECGYLNIQMQIDNYEMKINQKPLTLDAAPIIDNGRTLVPLRAVAEAFSAKVDWIQESQTVKISTNYPKSDHISENEFDNKHIRTSYGSYEYFDFLINNNKLIITGCISDNKIKGIALQFGIQIEHDTPVTPGKEFKITVDLADETISDETLINVWAQKNGDEMNRLYTSYIHNILYIQKNGNEYCFKKPLVWDNNKDFMSKWINPVGYIEADIDSEIVDLSNEICKGASNDYEKILKIHDWVADNIYYNYDYYFNSSSSDIVYDALSVYQSKRSVCEGYANLTQALIHAQNIPCRKVSGYALGLSSQYKYWTDETAAVEKSNHAWNQAYINNRWINIDTTWNSENKYMNGEFIYEGMENRFYFDISDVFFSYNHKYLRVK